MLMAHRAVRLLFSSMKTAPALLALICLAEKADLTVKVDTATLPEGKSLEAGTESLTILASDRKSTRLNSSH